MLLNPQSQVFGSRHRNKDLCQPYSCPPYLVESRPDPVAVVGLEEAREGHLVAAAPRRREDTALRLHGSLKFAPAVGSLTFYQG